LDLTTPWLSGMRVLLVDDSVSSLKMVSMLLRKLGCAIETASDGDDAVEMIRSSLSSSSDIGSSSNSSTGHGYSFVMMDNFMPRLCGPQAASQMRGLGYASLIVGLTGHALGDDLQAFLSAGADEVMSKPLDVGALQAIVAKYVDNKRISVAPPLPTNATPTAASSGLQMSARKTAR